MDLKRFELRIQRSENLPVLPQIVTQVLGVANKNDSTIRDLEKIIETDTAIAGKILRVANSAYYGTGGHCATLSNAVSMLGFNTIRALMVSLAYYQLTASNASSEHFSKSELWKHGLAVATGCSIIGKIIMPLETEELFIAGLLHDVGYMLMDMYSPRDLDRVIKAARVESKPVHEMEETLLGWGHTDAGEVLARKWNLPPMIAAAIIYHHKPIMAEENQKTAAIVGLSDHLAHECGFTNSAGAAQRELDPFILETLEMPEDQLNITRELIVDEVVKVQEAYSIAS